MEIKDKILKEDTRVTNPTDKITNNPSKLSKSNFSNLISNFNSNSSHINSNSNRISNNKTSFKVNRITTDQEEVEVVDSAIEEVLAVEAKVEVEEVIRSRNSLGVKVEIIKTKILLILKTR